MSDQIDKEHFKEYEITEREIERRKARIELRNEITEKLRRDGASDEVIQEVLSSSSYSSDDAGENEIISIMADCAYELNLRERYDKAAREINLKKGAEAMKNRVIEKLQRAGAPDDVIQLVLQVQI